jgi:ribosome-associated protein
MQYVAKILRRIDPEPIAQAIEDLKGEARHLTARQHRCEAWRDHLIREGDLALGQLMGARHDTDAQAVRQLVRNAVREAARDKPPAAARSLFRLLRDMDGLEPLPPPPSS